MFVPLSVGWRSRSGASGQTGGEVDQADREPGAVPGSACRWALQTRPLPLLSSLTSLWRRRCSGRGERGSWWCSPLSSSRWISGQTSEATSVPESSIFYLTAVEPNDGWKKKIKITFRNKISQKISCLQKKKKLHLELVQLLSLFREVLTVQISCLFIDEIIFSVWTIPSQFMSRFPPPSNFSDRFEPHPAAVSMCVSRFPLLGNRTLILHDSDSLSLSFFFLSLVLRKGKVLIEIFRWPSMF